MKPVVILGHGFAGLAIAAWIRRMASPSVVPVSIVDQAPYMVYRPLLAHSMDRAPTGLVRAARVPLATHWRRAGIRFIEDTVTGIDPARGAVTLAAGEPLAYDTLFVALGYHRAWTAVRGLDASRGGLCEDFLARHTAHENQTWRGGRFVFAIGPLAHPPSWSPAADTGFDLPLLESALLFDAWLRSRHLREASQLTIVTPARQVAAQAGPRARARLEGLLDDRRIALHTGVSVESVQASTLHFADGSAMAYDRSVWLPPARGLPGLVEGGLGDSCGWIPTTAHGRHPAYPNVYAVGDIVSQGWPKTGHAAMVEARVAVQHWWSRREGLPPPDPYRPEFLAIVELGGGQALFMQSDRAYGGSRDATWSGRIPALGKLLFTLAYQKSAGALPIMP